MKKILILIFATMAAMASSCNHTAKDPDPDPEPQPVTTTFAKGADIGWVTEMESKGYKFYNKTGAAAECTALLKSIGFNSVRYRVWVNPSDGWNNKEDVLVKAKRAKALGMSIMIDFHYSDTWADPGKQYPPEAWKNYSVTQMADAVSSHTKEVLNYLKDNGIDVTWVQVGNEVTNGMLWETGRVSGTTAANFVTYFNAGYSAVKSVYSDAQVILHLDNGWKTATLTWFYSLVAKNNIKYDIIGLSLYPSYWDSSSNSYPDWSTKTKQFVNNLPALHSSYAKPVMLVEFGMPATLPSGTKAAIQYILDNTKSYDYFKGFFYWEPESENSRNGYAYGAFSNGAPTSALDPFAD